jgi:outer membrane translocation and assembly module TamA
LKTKQLFFKGLIVSLLLAFSCSPVRRVPEGNYLLLDNKIKADDRQIDQEALKNLLRPKPNRKILGVTRFHLQVYNIVDQQKKVEVRERKEKRRAKKNKKRELKGKKPKNPDFKTWRELFSEIGEVPVLLDTNISKSTSRQLSLYLFQKGYFNNQVSDSVAYPRKKQAEVFYNIKAGTPYTIKEIHYSIPDERLAAYVQSDAVRSSILKVGAVYDNDDLILERERITKMLQNRGYFYFVKEFIHFEADTALGNHQLTLYVNIKNPEERKSATDTLISLNHKQYRINNIYINTNYNPKNINQGFTDTLSYKEFMFLHNKDLKYKPNIITQRIFLKYGDYYQVRNLEETYKKISDLNSFRFINIQFAEDENNMLNAHIMLSPVIKQGANFIAEGTHRAGYPGLAGNIVYTSNNPFGGAENIEIRLRGGVEAQPVDQQAGILNENNQLLFFNTIEFGPEISLHLPRFLLPIKPERFSKYFTPKTTITAAYNYQERPDLTRRIVSLSMNYNWRESRTKMHFIHPIELNMVNISLGDSLNNFFERISNPFLQRSFTPHATIGSRYTFQYNNQNISKRDNFFFFRGSVEGAGNLMRLIYNLANADTNELGAYEFFPNTPFAQYIKFDADFRYYRVLNEKHNFVVRTFAGIGVPMKNLNVLPLEKSYFGGGSNGIRAWPVRSLGPGSYTDTTSFNTLRLGDMSLEANFEYRFDIYRFFEGAFFVDAGNIWLVRKDRARPGGHFQQNGFLNQMAIGTGFGLRLDFSFFIFRLDMGIKVRDPMIRGDDKWVIQNIFDRNWEPDYLYQTQPFRRNYFRNINFGIGYPF